jgi:hypothetical protein
MPHLDDRHSSEGRLSEQLRAAECHAVEVRKLLRRLKGHLPRRVTVDAEKLANTIEKLSRLGRRCTAEIVVDVVSRIEYLTYLLGCEVDTFLRPEVPE